MVYWYFKKMAHLPDIPKQYAIREKVFRMYYPVEKMGAGTAHPCKSLLYADFLRRGDIVGVCYLAQVATNLRDISRTLRALHNRGVRLYIHDIGYDDDPMTENETEYRILEAFTQHLGDYLEKRSKRKGYPKAGRPGYHFEDLTNDQRNVIRDFRDGRMSARDAQLQMLEEGLDVSERVIYKLQHELDVIIGKPHSRKKRQPMEE